MPTPDQADGDDQQRRPARFALVLRDSGGVPGTLDARLRRALKSLLRAYGLRCESIREVAGSGSAGSPGAATPAGPGLLDDLDE